jgi:hypothetical protein
VHAGRGTHSGSKTESRKRGQEPQSMCPSPGPLPREDKNVQLQYYLGKVGGGRKEFKNEQYKPFEQGSWHLGVRATGHTAPPEYDQELQVVAK